MPDLFPDRSVSERDKIRCLERELRLRENVYPRQIARNAMTQAAADHEIACMTAILADYTRVKDTE